jgi:hypothetical protein
MYIACHAIFAQLVDMVGNLVAKVATQRRAELGDRYAVTLMAGSDGRPTPHRVGLVGVFLNPGPQRMESARRDRNVLRCRL